MYDHATGGIIECVANGRHIVSAPHRSSEGLQRMVGDPVTEDGELIVELMVDTGDLFPAGRWLLIAADELRTASRLREDSRGQQRGGIGTHHALWNDVAGKRAASYEACLSSGIATTIKVRNVQGDGCGIRTQVDVAIGVRVEARRRHGYVE